MYRESAGIEPARAFFALLDEGRPRLRVLHTTHRRAMGRASPIRQLLVGNGADWRRLTVGSWRSVKADRLGRTSHRVGRWSVAGSSASGWWSAMVAVVTACGGEGFEATPASMLSRALDAMGAPAVMESAGPFAIYASGTLDKAAEGQGYSPGVAAPGPFLETIAVDPSGSAVRWEYREDRYDGTHEYFGESYVSSTLSHLLVYDYGVAVPIRSASFATELRRLRRRIPHLLLQELLGDSDALRSRSSEGGMRRIVGRTDNGTATTVSVDPVTALVRQVEYQLSVPGRGLVTVEWWYDDYREVAGGVRLPFRYGSRVGDLEYTAMFVDSVTFGETTLFEPPSDLRVLDARDQPEIASDPKLEVHALAPGVFVVPEVRSGFAPLVVEFDTFLVAVDAPASFSMLGQIPAGETDAGPSMSWASERFVDALSERWPDKPVAYVVLTHHHEDHVGGVRAFVAEGATVLGARSTIEVVRALVALPALEVGDRLASTNVSLRTEVIDGPRRISDGFQTLEIIPVGDNPHADGMMVVSLPELGTLYVSDLLTPGPVESYPRSSHAALDHFFASWLTRSGLVPDSVWTMHGSEAITGAHLARLGSTRTRP
jgi:glyoxylase-like metal-dependent hydrolase (beta-lactamase superfamily II)